MIENKDYYIKNKTTSPLMIALSKILFFNKKFLTGYATTIGRTIYAPHGVVTEAVLWHELEHVNDYNKWGIAFSLSYLLLLPIGFTMRSFWERRGYEATIRYHVRYNPSWAADREFKERIVKQFTGPAYLYMDIRKEAVSEWFDKTLYKAQQEVV